METLFSTAEGLANCPEESQRYWLWRFISDEALAMATSNILILIIDYRVVSCTHSVILLIFFLLIP